MNTRRVDQESVVAVDTSSRFAYSRTGSVPWGDGRNGYTVCRCFRARRCHTWLGFHFPSPDGVGTLCLFRLSLISRLESPSAMSPETRRAVAGEHNGGRPTGLLPALTVHLARERSGTKHPAIH